MDVFRFVVMRSRGFVEPRTHNTRCDTTDLRSGVCQSFAPPHGQPF